MAGFLNFTKDKQINKVKIIDKIDGTVDSQKDPYKPLTSNQTKELKEKYQRRKRRIYRL